MSDTRIEPDQWLRLPPEVLYVMTEWIDLVIGRSMDREPYLFAVELGEGYLVTEEQGVDGDGWAREESKAVRVQYAAPIPPPCWPAPLPERFRA